MPPCFRGLAETARLLLEYGGGNYEDRYGWPIKSYKQVLLHRSGYISSSINSFSILYTQYKKITLIRRKFYFILKQKKFHFFCSHVFWFEAGCSIIILYCMIYIWNHMKCHKHNWACPRFTYLPILWEEIIF